MTDKQIIIDGVDVSGCIYFKKNNKTPMCRACNSGVGSPYCEYHKDCYYKNWKRKEQEYEILNIEIEDIAEARMEICNQCGERDDYNIPCKQIRDLDYGLKLEIEENEKLKQTLAEIKKIAEILAPMTNEYENCYDRDRCFECDFTEDCSYFNTKRIIQICNEVISEQ